MSVFSIFRRPPPPPPEPFIDPTGIEMVQTKQDCICGAPGMECVDYKTCPRFDDLGRHMMAQENE